MVPLRVGAINFLNSAPLLFDFEHSPVREELAERYTLSYTSPSVCAARLLAGEIDVGLIPVAALGPDSRVVPGCVIASLDRVRSILLIVRGGRTLQQVRSIATDSASRSSLAYTKILFRHFLGTDPAFLTPEAAEPLAMLAKADAALLIGDAALLAREDRSRIDDAAGTCLWIDLAREWVERTSLPWVAAVWAARPESLGTVTANTLIQDMNQSRLAGLAQLETIVHEWTPRIRIPPTVIREYLTHNIHYTLTPECIRSILLFRKLAAKIGDLRPLLDLALLDRTPSDRDSFSDF